jgi:hypothetical protein
VRLRPPGFTDKPGSPAGNGRVSERSRESPLRGEASPGPGKTAKRSPGTGFPGTGKPAQTAGALSSIREQLSEGAGLFKVSGEVPRAPAGGSPAPVREGPLLELARTLSLPPDGLSAALLSFVRFFSLPLEKNLLLQLRRESLGPPGGGKEPGRLREARALGAAAAADKGLSLDPRALEEYARAITGDGGFEADSGGSGGQDRSGEPPAEEAEKTDKAGNVPAEETRDREAGEELQRKIRAVEAEKPLLRLLNSVPGKNGRRWIVLPFHFASGGIEIGVSVRILLYYNHGPEVGVERLAVDLTAGDRHWLFVLNRPGGADSGADVYLQPPPGGSSRSGLEAELRELLGRRADHVTLHPGEFPLADGRNDALPSVNEEV